MSTIKNRLYKAITNEFSSSEELSELKTYWHNCFKNFGGKQGLKTTKQDAFTSQMMGANNINTMSSHFDNKKFESNQELFAYICDNVFSVFGNDWEIVSSESNSLILAYQLAEIEADEDIIFTYYFDFSILCHIKIDDSGKISIEFEYDLCDQLEDNWLNYSNLLINESLSFKHLFESGFNLDLKDVSLTRTIVSLLEIKDIKLDKDLNFTHDYYIDEYEFVCDALSKISGLLFKDLGKLTESKVKRVKTDRSVKKFILV